MITQRDLLFFGDKNKKQLDKTYYLLAGMLAEMENDDPRRGLARKLVNEYGHDLRRSS